MANWFVALPVRAEGLVEGLAAGLPTALRLFAPTDLHLTLAFFGTLEAQKVPVLVDALQKIRFEPFEITLGKLLPLPSPKHVTALSFELVQGREAAVELMRQWRDPLLALAGAPPETRGYLPHITVARPQRKAGQAGQAAALQWLPTVLPPARPLELRSAALYTWADDRKLQQFKIVAEV